jgi:Na+/phosphate symporter
MVNDNINKYNDLVADFKRSAIDRINSITLNKLATSEDLLKEKKSIADNFRTTITDLERQFREDQRTLADDAVKSAEAIRINSDRIKNERLEKL